jgi:hypothetical protein
LSFWGDPPWIFMTMQRVQGVWPYCEEPPSPGPATDDQGESLTLHYNPRRPSAGRRVAAIHATLRAGRESWMLLRAVNVWFKWAAVPRSIRVSSWSGDTSIRALAKVC